MRIQKQKQNKYKCKHKHKQKSKSQKKFLCKSWYQNVKETEIMVSIESKEQVEVRAVFGYRAKVQFRHSKQQSQYLPSVPEFLWEV